MLNVKLDAGQKKRYKALCNTLKPVEFKTLHLPLKREYFEQIQDGSKEFEFRRYNKYWRKRLEGNEFDQIKLTLGYPKKGDMSRTIIKPWLGYYLKRITHKHFGNEQVKVFAIKVN